AVEAAEGHLHPLIRTALLRERGADLGHHEHVRRNEDDREQDQPEEALGPVRGDRAERVEPDERADGEEHHVEAAQRLDQLALLVRGEDGYLFVLDDAHDIRLQAWVRTSPRIPTISPNSCGPATSGGEICTTGSPRSSARQIRPCSNSAGERKPRRSVSDSSSLNVSRVSLSLTSSSAHRYPAPRRSRTISSSRSVASCDRNGSAFSLVVLTIV